MAVVNLFNSLKLRPNRRPFADDIFKCIFLNENEWISSRISLKFVPKVPINNIPALVQIMAWCRSGGKPLSEPMMVSLQTHLCVTRPQWVYPPLFSDLQAGRHGRFKTLRPGQMCLNLKAFFWIYTFGSMYGITLTEELYFVIMGCSFIIIFSLSMRATLGMMILNDLSSTLNDRVCP